MKLKLLPAALLFAASLSLTEASAVDLTIGQEHASDVTFELYTKIKEAEKMGGGCTISFEKGTYHFYPEFAYERYEYFSNHGDRLTSFGCCLENMKDVTIDGNGSEFIFHGIMTPFHVENCEDITIKNISVDFAEAFHSEGLIIARDEQAGTFDMQFSEEYPFEIRNGELISVRSYYDFPTGQTYLYDPATGFVAYNTTGASGIPYSRKIEEGDRYMSDNFSYINKVDIKDHYIRNRGIHSGADAEHLGNGVVRISGLNNGKRLPEIGWMMIMKGHQGYNRLAPGFKAENSKRVNLYDVDIHHAPGMGFLYENCEDVLLERCTTIASNGRLISVTADATHFVGCRGQLTMRGCTFQSQLDDGTNIHGAHQEVVSIIDRHTIGARMGHHQQMGYVLARPGDKIGIIAPKRSTLPHAELTLASYEVVNSRLHLFTFEEELPEDFEIEYLLENLTAYPEVLIEECHFSRNRAHAILISTPRKSIVRNNFMSTEMGAIALSGGTGEDYWYECGIASNLTIEGNTMRDCAMGAKATPIIGFFVRKDKGDGSLFKNIKILNNKFEYTDNWALEFNCCEDVLVKGNSFVRSETYPQRHPECSVVTIAASEGVSFKNNHYEGDAKEMIEYRDQSARVEFK